MTPDTLYLDASIHSAKSETGFKVSVLRGTLRFVLSTRPRNNEAIVVEMSGYKSMRILGSAKTDMNSAGRYENLDEQLCLIRWSFGDGLVLQAGQPYTFEFSGLLDARLPRTMKTGEAKIRYRLTAHVGNHDTEIRLVVPWSRYCRYMLPDAEMQRKQEEIRLDEQDGALIVDLPAEAIKGPERHMTIRVWPTKSVSELHLTNLSIELSQEVSINFTKLGHAHHEPHSSLFSERIAFPPACDASAPLVVRVPLPIELHAHMKSPHMSVSHSLKLTVHRGGVRQKKVYTTHPILHHLDLDTLEGSHVPLIDFVLTRENNDPVYEYHSSDKKFADAENNVL